MGCLHPHSLAFNRAHAASEPSHRRPHQLVQLGVDKVLRGRVAGDNRWQGTIGSGPNSTGTGMQLQLSTRGLLAVNGYN